MPLTPRASQARKGRSSVFASQAALALLALLVLATPGLAAPEAAETAAPERALAPGPVRHVLVKALGQGASPQEAEQQALENARALAARHLAGLGGAQALLPGDEGQRIVTLKHFPAMGFGAARVVALVELRLRGQVQPKETDHALLSLRADAAANVLTLEANRPCEAVAASLPAQGAEPELLPGGTQSFRLTPGKPLRHPLPGGLKSLDVLACTGGLSVPADPSTLAEAFTKARAGRPRPAQLEGVVSDCVELRLTPAAGAARSMRLKSSDAPVNMTGAAGRESGLPVPAKAAP